jgi:hypothetical protein
MPQQSSKPGVVTLTYNGHPVTYQEDGWFNATEAAAPFGKRPGDWLKLQSSDDYISALCRHLRREKISLLKVIRGGRHRPDGTWFHPKLAVPFARWLDDEFAIWCDVQIDALIRGDNDWKRLRHASAASYKVMQMALKETREQAGKGCAVHHYTNEARLVNWALAGKFEGMNREAMNETELDLLGHLEIRNTLLIAKGVEYDQRKAQLSEQAKLWKVANQPMIEKSA